MIESIKYSLSLIFDGVKTGIHFSTPNIFTQVEVIICDLQIGLSSQVTINDTSKLESLYISSRTLKANHGVQKNQILSIIYQV